MLIQKKYTFDELVGKIVAFQLTNGNDMITKVKEITDDVLVVEKPQRLVLQQDGNIMPFPYALVGQDADEINLFKSQIVVWYTPDEATEKHFEQSITTIQLA